MLAFLLVSVACLIIGRSEAEFTYKDPENWGGECQTGRKQSPIDLALKMSSFERVNPMYFLRYDESTHFEVQNNGHTIKLKLDQPCHYQIAGGNLPDIYTLDHIHFHWKSEHLVDGKRMPAEAHFVHYKQEYKSVDEASTKPNGLAVLGVLFQMSDSDNKILKELLPYMGNQSNWQTPKYHLAPRKLLPKYRASFFRYQGSLTTPPCSESVIWTVFRDRLPISKAQVDQLHTIFFDGSNENYRPVQKLNGRPLSIMTFDDKWNKPGLSCAKPSRSDRAMCFLLALAGVISPSMISSLQ